MQCTMRLGKTPPPPPSHHPLFEGWMEASEVPGSNDARRSRRRASNGTFPPVDGFVAETARVASEGVSGLHMPAECFCRIGPERPQWMDGCTCRGQSESSGGDANCPAPPTPCLDWTPTAAAMDMGVLKLGTRFCQSNLTTRDPSPIGSSLTKR